MPFSQETDRAYSLVVKWLGRRTHNSGVEGSPPSRNTVWLFISETGDHLLAGKLSWEL